MNLSMNTNKPTNEIEATEQQIQGLVQKLAKLRQDAPPTKVKNYRFQDLNGEVSLLELFGEREKLFAIHNMGQGCRYCTLWADGLNGFVPHLEDKFAFVLLSKDSPELQRRYANSRGWRYRMASHGGGEYIQEQSVAHGEKNMPGIICYERRGDEIFRKNASVFGPGDLFCSLWHVLSLGGYNAENWTPQYSYWQRPGTMDDGGKNVL
jgi:predicted dithiol-disulfide oxidoreductase (DUF899 family)